MDGLIGADVGSEETILSGHLFSCLNDYNGSTLESYDYETLLDAFNFIPSRSELKIFSEVYKIIERDRTSWKDYPTTVLTRVQRPFTKTFVAAGDKGGDIFMSICS